MIILTNKDFNVIIDIADIAETVVNGIKVSKGDSVYIYARAEEFNIDQVETVPEDVVPQKYLYVDGGFDLNPSYVEPPEEV